MLNKLEVLADAIAYYHKAHEPDSVAYQLRNPGKLKAISPKHPRTEEGFRLFNSYLDGYQALLFDLKIKCQGRSRATIVESNLNGLLQSYGQPQAAAKYIARQITKALKQEIRANEALTFFLGV